MFVRHSVFLAKKSPSTWPCTVHGAYTIHVPNPNLAVANLILTIKAHAQNSQASKGSSIQWPVVRISKIQFKFNSDLVQWAVKISKIQLQGAELCR